MKIDEMKNSFIELLRTSFDTGKKEEIQISEKVLAENSLNERTFWEKICPLLQKEGVLKSFDDPDYILSDFQNYLLSTVEYKAESKNMNWLMNHSTDTPNYNFQLNALTSRLARITAKYRKIYWHKFVVNKEKLLQRTTDNKDGSRLFIFTLTKNGTLSRKDALNGDRPYKMDAGRLRHSILRELAEAHNNNNDFYDTNELANVLGVSAKQIRKAVAGMKKRMVKMFNGLKKDDFIESSKNSGYRLHKQIRIIKT